MKRLLAGMALLAATPASAVNGMRMIGFGPVQATMGGVGVGASLDAGTTVSNPAGMADLGGRVDFGASYFSPTVDGTVMQGTPNEQTYKSGRGATPVPAFGLVIPIGKDLRFGLGAYGIAGMGVDYDIGHSNYSQMRFTPALSYRLLDMLSVGATVNVMYANLDFGAYLPNPAPPPNTIAVVYQGGAAFGLGATVAAKLTALPILDVAVAYETKSSFADFKFKGVDQMTGQPLAAITFDQPPAFTIGASLKPLPILLVAADVQFLQWSATQGTSEQVGPFGTLNWKDQWVYKIGAQLDLEVIKVRAGFDYGKSPVDASANAAVFMPAIQESHVTVGVGLPLASNVAVNVGTVISPKVTATGTSAFFGAQEVSVSAFTLEGGLSVTY